MDVTAWFRGPPERPNGSVRETEDLSQAETTKREVEVQMACLSREELEEVVLTLAMKSADARSILLEVYERSSTIYSSPSPSKRPHTLPQLPSDSLSRLCSKYLPSS